MKRRGFFGALGAAIGAVLLPGRMMRQADGAVDPYALHRRSRRVYPSRRPVVDLPKEEELCEYRFEVRGPLLKHGDVVCFQIEDQAGAVAAYLDTDTVRHPAVRLRIFSTDRRLTDRGVKVLCK